MRSKVDDQLSESKVNKRRSIFIDAYALVPPISGVGYYLKSIIDNLVKSNKYDIELGTLSSFYSNERKINYENKDVKQKIVKFLPRSIYILLMRLNIAPPIDIFFGRHDLYFFENYVCYPVKSGKTITVIHDLTFKKFPHAVFFINRMNLNFIVPYTLNKSDVIVTVSNSIKKEIYRYYSPKKKIHVIYPSIDKSLEEDDSLLKTYSLKKDEYIYFVGNLEPRKNLINLIKAFNEAKLKNMKLVISGNKGWKNNKIMELLKSENVLHIGSPTESQKNSLIKNCLFLSIVSIYEGFGMPIIEGFKYNKAVLMSDIESFREISKMNFFCDPHNVNDIRKKMESLYYDTRLRQKLERLGTERYKYFSSIDQSHELEDIFK